LSQQDSLKERIKELECLYDISSLISKSTELKPALPRICKRLTKAFQFPSITLARITLHGETFGNAIEQANPEEIKQAISFQGEIIGYIRVWYSSEAPGGAGFLEEEKKLLNKVAQEVAFLYEREQSNQKEAVLNEIVRRQDRLTALGEMTAGVAHEINTPLSNVIGFSEFIIESSRESKTRKDAKKIKQSALHAREIVKKLMLFSCKIPQKLETIKIKPILDEALELLSPVLKQSGIRVKVTNNCPLATASIDKVQFIQVLFNLINNAIQASKPKDTILINVNNIKGCISMAIQDFGIGIPHEIQANIFNPFFTFNKQGTGNGLGLSVVHGIIKQLKGRIQFSSEPNIGSTFVISIPQ